MECPRFPPRQLGELILLCGKAEARVNGDWPDTGGRKGREGEVPAEPRLSRSFALPHHPGCLVNWVVVVSPLRVT